MVCAAGLTLAKVVVDGGFGGRRLKACARLGGLQCEESEGITVGVASMIGRRTLHETSFGLRGNELSSGRIFFGFVK